MGAETKGHKLLLCLLVFARCGVHKSGRKDLMKKALNIIGKIATVLIILLAVFVMVFTFITIKTSSSEDATIFGYKPYIVLSDSMKDTFEVGDVVVIKAVPAEELQPGDIVCFKSIDPNNYGMVVTHKIREITTYNEEPSFVTYGTTTGADDAYPVPYDRVVGKYITTLPKLGQFFEFLKSPAGYVFIILIPFLLLILWQAANIVKLFKRYKKEKESELSATDNSLPNEENPMIAESSDDSTEIDNKDEALIAQENSDNIEE